MRSGVGHVPVHQDLMKLVQELLLVLVCSVSKGTDPEPVCLYVRLLVILYKSCYNVGACLGKLAAV